MGRGIRLAQLLRPGTSRAVLMAVDHGLAGSMPGLEDPLQLLRSVLRATFEGLVVSAGLADVAGNLLAVPGRPRLIISLDAPVFSTRPGTIGPLEDIAMVATPARAAALGASAVKLVLPAGLASADRYRRVLADLSTAVAEAHRLGLPVMLEPTLWGPLAERADEELAAHTARVAVEMGADMVKIAAPAMPEDLSELIVRLGVPVFLMGGTPRTAEELVDEVLGYRRAGATGIVFGRNVFTRSHPELAVEALAELLHGEDSDKARKLLADDVGS